MILSLSVAFIWDTICLQLQALNFEIYSFPQYQKRPSLSVQCGMGLDRPFVIYMQTRVLRRVSIHTND